MKADPLRSVSAATGQAFRKQGPPAFDQVPPGLEPERGLDQIASSITANLGALAPVYQQPTRPVRKHTPMGWLLRAVGWTGAAAAAATGVVGAIAYQGNRAALSEPSVSVMMDADLMQGSGPPPVRLDQVGESQQLHLAPADHQGVTVTVPADTVRSFTRELRANPEVKRFLAGQIATATGRVESQLRSVKVPPGALMVGLKTPLPVGNHALLHIGSLDLPSFGLHSLKREDVPMVLRYATDPIDTHLKLDVRPVELKQAPSRHDGIFLGAVQARLSTDGDLVVKGRAQLGLDLDGKVTGEKLQAVRHELAQASPGSQRQAHLRGLSQRLEARLARGAELRRDPAARKLLEDAFKAQKVSFQAHVDSSGAPLAKVTYGMWLVPDKTGDGRADIAVHEISQSDRLAGLRVQVDQLHRIGRGQDLLNREVSRFFRSGVESAVPRVAGQLKKLAAQRLGSELARGGDLMQGTANQRLAELYHRWSTRGVSLDTHSDMLGAVTARLGAVEVTPGGKLEVSLGTVRGAGHMQTGLAGMKLAPGELAVRLDGALVNAHLRDRSQGGSIDWKGILARVKASDHLRRIEFGRDAQGRTVYPRLEMDHGKPCLVFDITAQTDGLEPVADTTGVVNGITGAVDHGAASLQKTLEKKAGVAGEVLGGILRAPTFLVHSLTEGGKAVLDHTIGKVADAAPEVLTRPTVHTRVSIPIDFRGQGDHLSIAPEAHGVRFSKASTSLPFNVLDLVPTRLLSNLVANLAARAVGPGEVGAQAASHTANLDLAPFGVKVHRVEVVTGGHGHSPDLLFALGVTDQAANFAAQQLAD